MKPTENHERSDAAAIEAEAMAWLAEREEALRRDEPPPSIRGGGAIAATPPASLNSSMYSRNSTGLRNAAQR